MQDVNNDMDDLFRKAAEQYPLQTEGADWQKVFAGLQDASMPVAEEKEKKKRRFLWLFLLLPLGLLWAVYYKGDHQPEQQTAVVMKDVKPENNDSQTFDSTFNKKSSSELQNSDDVVPELSSGEGNSNKKKSVADENTSALSVSKEKMRQKNVHGIHSSGSVSLTPRKEDFSYNQSASNNNVDLANNSTNNQTSSNKNNFSSSQPNASTDRIDMESKRDSSNKIIGEVVLNKTDSTRLTNAKTDSVANRTDNKDKSKRVKAKPDVQNGFYAGLLASLDVSTIKLQRINKTGYGFELLLGYRFSKRISVESGINWTDKKYYSTGKYFDKSRTDIPEASKIIYTNGSCAMFEIPATVKYDFAQKKKSNWFATAGLSSYIMKDETYSYYANHSGNYYNATKKYSHSGSNLFSVASLSLGYQLQLGKHLSLRAEPYIKMPLSGIGIAKMPVTSAGIAAGFTRKF